MKLLLYPDELLSTVCDPVEEFNDELHEQLDAMIEMMRKCGGMGLAANQVGIANRVVVMAGIRRNPETKQWGFTGDIYEFINPEIIEESEDTCNYREGCLSSPDIKANVPSRNQQVTIKAFDRHGEEKTYIATELESVCVQHEIDHLDGIFFFDRLSRQEARAARKRWQKKRTKLGL